MSALMIFALVGQGQTPEPSAEASRAAVLKQMESIAKQTEVRLNPDNVAARLVEAPVFRYNDLPRGFEDCTLWVWTDQGRPVALQKVEAKVDGVPRRPGWSFCFTSFSTGTLSAEWTTGRTFKSTEPGVTFTELSKAPAPVEASTQRRLQARRLAARFSGRIFDVVTGVEEEMRFLPKPVFEYEDPDSKLYRGAIFGLTAHGTNPDAFVCIEVREAEDGAPRWHYAAARMTNGGVSLKYGEQEACRFERVGASNAVFPTWTFFSEPREAPEVR